LESPQESNKKSFQFAKLTKPVEKPIDIHQNKLNNQLFEMEKALKQMNISSLSHDIIDRDFKDGFMNVGSTKYKDDNVTSKSFLNFSKVSFILF